MVVPASLLVIVTSYPGASLHLSSFYKIALLLLELPMVGGDYWQIWIGELCTSGNGHIVVPLHLSIVVTFQRSHGDEHFTQVCSCHKTCLQRSPNVESLDGRGINKTLPIITSARLYWSWYLDYPVGMWAFLSLLPVPKLAYCCA